MSSEPAALFNVPDAEPGAITVAELLRLHGDKLSLADLRKLLRSLVEAEHVHSGSAMALLNEYGSAPHFLIEAPRTQALALRLLVPKLLEEKRLDPDGRWAGLSYSELMQDPVYREFRDRWWEVEADLEVEMHCEPVDREFGRVTRNLAVQLQGVALMNAALPHVRARLKRLEHNREAGRRKKGSNHKGTPSYETRRAKVAEFMDRGETHNAACERAARALGCSKSSVYRVTRDLLPPSE